MTGLDDAAVADTAPGDDRLDSGGESHNVGIYLIGLALAALLTCVSFFIARTTLVWTPSIPVALAVLAVAQMGVHLVFFIHITTGPDNTNNIMALAFGILIVLLVMGGSLFIMTHMNHNMMPMTDIMRMQRCGSAAPASRDAGMPGCRDAGDGPPGVSAVNARWRPPDPGARPVR